ncbi:hypothetical protein J2W24_006350 [Variovorax boronicumulans]|uniref:hypothetical protein n=1 Tax=Variovorax boronicumulans TaxID=436515 RepID=UPI00278B86CC|nr:hypothetical protein [Variovorax boronicumulans]MDP9920668.1 hypothetical protein [Variovorax boronicumulans]
MRKFPLPALLALIGFISPAWAQATAEDIPAFCVAVSNAAVEAGRLRDEGKTALSATETLRGMFSAEELRAGVNTAFSYKNLKEFALSDLSSAYCARMLATNGTPNDFDKLWLRTHYERAAECSAQGHVERESFQGCWNAQQARDLEGSKKVVLPMMNLEYILAEKGACESRFPKYATQNQQAFGASTLSRISSEALIDKYAGIGAKQGLLRALDNHRKKTAQMYQSMDAVALEKRCINFPQSPELSSGK